MSDFKVSIGLNSTELDAGLKKAQGQLGTVTAGVGKGLAAAAGSSLGPFGELIEKANAFTGAMNGASAATKVFAGAVGLAMVGTTLLVKEAIDAFKEMREAQNDAAEAGERLKKSQSTLAGDILKNGIASGQEARTRTQLIDRDVSLVGDTSPQAVAERARIQQALSDIRSGEAVRRGESRLFNETLSPSARAMRGQRDLEERARGSTPADLSRMISERQSLQGSFDVFSRGDTKTEADAANRAKKSIEDLDKLIEATEAVMKERETKVPGLLSDFFGTLDEESKARAKASKEAVKEADQEATAKRSMPSLSYGVSSAIGGGGNIYGGTYAISQNTMQAQANQLAKLSSIDTTLKNIERRGGSFR